MAASTRSLSEEIPRIPTGKPGAIANRIFLKVARKSKSRKTSESSSSSSTDYYETTSVSPRPFSNNRRKDLKGRILEIFEENENEYVGGDNSGNESKDYYLKMEKPHRKSSNLERDEEVEEDKRKAA